MSKMLGGTLTIPTDSPFSVEDIKTKLSNMEYIRRLDITLYYNDGAKIDDFYGNYKVSLLIPGEFKEYEEFLVVYKQKQD